MNDVLAIFLQMIAFGLIFGSAYFYLTLKVRSKRLENSTEVEVGLLLEGLSLLPIRFFQPSKHFISNMTKALELHYKEVREVWGLDKVAMMDTWVNMDAELKEEFLKVLSSELTQSLESYSSKGDLSSLLCPTLRSKQLASNNKLDGENKDQPNISILFDFICADDALCALEMYPIIEVVRLKVIPGEPTPTLLPENQSPAVESSKLSPLSPTIDVNAAETKETSKPYDNGDGDDDVCEMKIDCQRFLQSLKILCYYLYAKQFMLRFATFRKPESKLKLVIQQSGRSALVALAALLFVWILNEADLLTSVFWFIPGSQEERRTLAGSGSEISSYSNAPSEPNLSADEF